MLPRGFMATEVRSIPTDQVVRLNVQWNAYQALVDSLGDHSRARLTFDGEALEIMSPGPKHERIVKQIDALISTIVLEWNFNIEGTGSTTFRKIGETGFEADESYYIQHADQIRDLDEIDLSIPPPPDLNVEVDISNLRDDKKKLYARLGLPEFWRYRDDRLEAFALSGEQYAAIDVSVVIPGLPINQIQQRLRASGSRLTMITSWQHWLRENRQLHEAAKL